MKLTNKFNLPAPIVAALSENNYTKGESHRSVTTLIDSPRVRILREKYEDQIEEDVSEMMWSVLGTATHNIFENHAEGEYVSEERLFVKKDGWIISGAIDLQDENGPSDYKVTSVWSVIFDKKEWHNQLNAYAWLMRHAKGRPSKRLRIIAILRDWKRRDAETKDDYPESPIMIVDIPMWTEQEQDEYMEERIRIHQEAELRQLSGEPLPPCSDHERWKKEDSYAVRKKTNKRALRVFSCMDDANDFVKANSLEKDHVVDLRQGVATRCDQNWCRVAEWCDQYQSELGVSNV